MPPAVVLVSPSFQSNLFTTYRPYAEKQWSTLQEAIDAPGATSQGAASSPQPAGGGNFGDYSLIGDRVVGFNFRNNFTASLTPNVTPEIVQVICTVASIKYSAGGGLLGAAIIQIAAQATSTLGCQIAINGQNPLSGQIGLHSFAFPFNSASQCALYFTGGKCGMIVGGVDQGFIQRLGSDMIFNFNENCGFILEQQSRNVLATDPQKGKMVCGGFVFQSTDLTGLPLPAGNWQDFGGNLL